MHKLEMRRLKLLDHLPIAYDVLRGDSYSNWNSTRQEIMKNLMTQVADPKRELFFGDSPCLSCGVSDFNKIFKKEQFDFVECKACHLVQVNPLPRPELVDRFYNTPEYSKFMVEHMISKNEYRRERFGNERVKAWGEFLPSSVLQGEKRMLDVGCGSGFVLEAAIENGWEAYGLDLNLEAVDAARAKGLTAYDRKLEDLQDEEMGLFDVITMYDVLEHSYNPREMLLAAKRHLKKEGLLVIYVPNWDSLARQIMGKETFWIWGLFHLSYFSINTLDQMIESVGLTTITFETQGMDVADIVWFHENIKEVDMNMLKENIEIFQYCCNASGQGSGLRVFVRK
jgi:2-polyprenyl-3-methyl-5-hydroxy-6-metoxy-1,4-benzoquinol methylase